MTEKQRAALRYMADNRIGATLTPIGWVWRNDVRLSEDAAQAIIDKYDIVEEPPYPPCCDWCGTAYSEGDEGERCLFCTGTIKTNTEMEHR